MSFIKQETSCACLAGDGIGIKDPESLSQKQA